MRAKGHASSAMYANVRLLRCDIDVYSLYRAGLGAFIALDAQFFIVFDTAILTLLARPGRAGNGTGGRVARLADTGLKTTGKAPG